jgi:flagellar biosynthetic protein FliO
MDWVVVKSLLSLLAVLALMAAIVFALRKYAFKGQLTNTSMVDLSVLGHRMLGPKRGMYVVKVMNKILVVGVTEGGMTSLGEIDDAQSLRQIDEQLAVQEKPVTGFADYFQKYLHVLSPAGSKNTGKVMGVSAE